MRPKVVHLVICSAVLLGLGYVPGAVAVPSPTPEYTHRKHVTQLGYRVNDPCPRGTYKYFALRAWAGHAGIVSVGQHTLKLTDGTTIRSIPKQTDVHGSQIMWRFHRASRFAKIYPYLSASGVLMTTLSKDYDWSDYVSRQCLTSVPAN